MKGIRHLATTPTTPRILAPRALGRLVAFQYERARTFGHHETARFLENGLAAVWEGRCWSTAPKAMKNELPIRH